MRWQGASWLAYATISAISIGIHILRYANRPHDILVFLGGWLVSSGVAGLIIMLVMLVRAPKNPEARKPDTPRPRT